MAVRGITKVRNEAHIIGDTLDNWAQWCDAGIHVYCDHCTDRGSTAQICREHKAVNEVIQSDLLDPDRERAEWFTRSMVLRSALRFCSDDDWVVYFDADEHLEQFNVNILNDQQTDMICCESYDAYITPEDAHYSEWDYSKRRWVMEKFQLSPYFYRCRNELDFCRPDQRNMDLPRDAGVALEGKVIHWGKAISVSKWEEKCDYYTETFGPKYAEKCAARRGQAVKEDMKCDFGLPLVLWEDVKKGKVPSSCRNGLIPIR